MDKVEEFIHREKTLKAMVRSRLPKEIAPKKKRNEFKKADREEQRPAKNLKDYDFMPLNDEISEVLIKIKRD
jgi:hypothetical protein